MMDTPQVVQIDSEKQIDHGVAVSIMAQRNSSAIESSGPMKKITPTAWFAVRAGFVASLGGLHAGYDLGSTAFVISKAAEEFDLNTVQKEFIPSVMIAGSVVGSLFCYLLLNKFGRRDTILMTACMFLVAGFVAAFAKTFAVLLIARAILGVAVAISLVADSIYLLEIAPPEWRGVLVTCNELMLATGIVLAFGFGATLESWRLLLGLPVILALFQIIGVLSLPRSPRWLVQQRREEEALDALIKIYPSPSSFADSKRESDSQEEREQVQRREEAMGSIRKELSGSDSGSNSDSDRDSERDIEAGNGALGCNSPTNSTTSCSSKSESTPAPTPVPSLCQVIRQYFPQVLVATVVLSMQNLSGNPVVMYYAPIIFESAGFGDASGHSISADITVIIGIVKLIATIFTIFKLENCGRRPLLLGGAAGLFVGWLMMASAYIPADWVGGNHSIIGGLAVAGAVIFVMSWTPSYGAMGLLVSSEIFPTSVRAQGMSVATTIQWLCNYAVSQSYLSETESVIGTAGTFVMFAAFCALGFVFSYLAVVETKQKHVEQIHEEMKQLWIFGGKMQVARGDTKDAHGLDGCKVEFKQVKSIAEQGRIEVTNSLRG